MQPACNLKFRVQSSKRQWGSPAATQTFLHSVVSPLAAVLHLNSGSKQGKYFMRYCISNTTSSQTRAEWLLRLILSQASKKTVFGGGANTYIHTQLQTHQNVCNIWIWIEYNIPSVVMNHYYLFLNYFQTTWVSTSTGTNSSGTPPRVGWLTSRCIHLYRIDSSIWICITLIWLVFMSN